MQQLMHEAGGTKKQQVSNENDFWQFFGGSKKWGVVSVFLAKNIVSTPFVRGVAVILNPPLRVWFAVVGDHDDDGDDDSVAKNDTKLSVDKSLTFTNFNIDSTTFRLSKFWIQFKKKKDDYKWNKT